MYSWRIVEIKLLLPPSSENRRINLSENGPTTDRFVYGSIALVLSSLGCSVRVASIG